MQLQLKQGAGAAAILLLQFAFLSSAVAQNKSSVRTAPQEVIHPTAQILDVNNMTTWITRDAKFDWIDHFSHVNGGLPKGTSAGAVFAQGFVWGGIVEDGRAIRVRVNGSTYQTGMDPGRVLRDANGNVVGPDDPSDRAKYHVYRVVRNWRDLSGESRNEFLRASASQFYGVLSENVSPSQMQDVADQYEYDWVNWPAEWGAPFEDVNGDGLYDPETDIPGEPGAAQTLWVVTNDLRPGVSEQSYGSPPIGVELQQTIWGYDFAASAPLGNISFIRSRLIYTGLPDTPSDARIDSMFAVWWTDPDVGDFSNDFSGSDTTLSLGYSYNAETSDVVYRNHDLAPPAIGWDFLQGPITAEGDTLDMTSFVYFAAGSDISDPDLSEYSGTLQWFNLMRGMRPRPEYPAGDPFINSITGEETEFALTGDPVTGSGWIDGMDLPPGDRRMVQSTGPFEMELGDTLDVVVGQVGAIGTGNLSSVTVLKFYDQFAQFAYDQDFELPTPPPTPPVNVAELEDEIVLNWGFDHEAVERVEDFESQGFRFEGYNVYQLPSRTASVDEGVKLASFDKENLVSTIFDNVIDEETGFVIQRPVQISPNEGLQRFISITEDQIRGRPLANGVRYHFALTTYSYLPTDEPVPFRMMESPPVVLTVVPQPPRPGVTNVTPHATEFDVSQAAGSGDATIVARTVDPSQLTDATWTVTFSETDGEGSWNLLKDGQPAITNQPFGPSTEIPVVDGIQVNVSDVTFSAPSTILSHEQVEGSGLALWGDATLFGAATGFYDEFTGLELPSVEDATPDLEFRFTGNGAMEAPSTEGGQLASYYEREAFDKTDLSEFASEVIRMPFELWDVENDRQVNFAVIGRNADGESPWGDGVGEYYRMSARDYIVPVMTEYDESTVQSTGTSPVAPEATWLLFFLEGGASVWETGDVYRVRFANPVSAGLDEFQFATEASEAGVEDDVRASIDEIKVFPNPYLGFSKLETSRFNKFVTFTHLPERATIRIFNMAGTMVRVLEHDSPTQFEEWDLTNQDDLPVASGVYIAHVETEFGEKVLKIALVQEEQILQRY